MFGFAFLETESMWGVQERLSEIVTPRYLAEGTDSKTVPWSMYLVWMGHLALVICRTWHLDGLKLMSHRFSHISRVWRSFCRIIDSPSELIARYMAVSSAKSLTLDLTWSGRSFIYARKSMGPRTEPCGTPGDTAILSDLTPFKTTAWVSHHHCRHMTIYDALVVKVILARNMLLLVAASLSGWPDSLVVKAK